jgi:hypothetical protein
MARIQEHHITYRPEWKVELNMLMHRTISRIQQTKATGQQYADVTNFMHSVSYEWNRMRQELDTGEDLRVVESKRKKGGKGDGSLRRTRRKE